MRIEIKIEPDFAQNSDFVPWTSSKPHGYDKGTLRFVIWRNLLTVHQGEACCAVALLLIWAAPDRASAEIFGDYVGYTACEQCHPKQVKGWKTTRHGNAFADLKTQGAEKQTIPGCFRCHVVGYGQDGGYLDQDLTPELADVQCEA